MFIHFEKGMLMTEPLLVHVPVFQRTITMLLPEAERHLAGVQEAIRQAKCHEGTLQPPTTEDGWLDHQTLRVFFEQLSCDIRTRHSRASKLYNRLMLIATSGQLKIRLQCISCGEQEEGQEHCRHWGRSSWMKLNVESLKQVADEFRSGRYPKVGMGIRNDFDLLVAHL